MAVTHSGTASVNNGNRFEKSKTNLYRVNHSNLINEATVR